MLTYDRRVMLLAAAAGVPGLLLASGLMLAANLSWPVRGVLVGAAIAATAWIVAQLRTRIVRPLQTVSNLLAALKEDDFSIRARGASGTDALGQVMHDVNALAETLRAQRLGAQEATALLRGVMAELQVAIFAFDADGRLALVNHYGAQLLGSTSEALEGQLARDLALEAVLTRGAGIEDVTFPGGAGRWEIRRRQFWQGGHPHDLLMLTDVSQSLRAQERDAWQRLIRVLSHELNNSLAPIKSIAGSLNTLVARPALPDDWRDDMTRGLAVIAARADALGRFTGAYAQLARLPPPTVRPTSVAALMQRISGIETRLAVALREGPRVTIPADADQLEQLLINVIRNAVDAAIETGGGVSAGWSIDAGTIEIWVEDEGPGVRNTSNLFVPFFTTKPGGTGIGLVLSRQIAEAHGGTLTLTNRLDRAGTRAVVRLPFDSGTSTPSTVAL